MPRRRHVALHTYRHHRIEVHDDGGRGWELTIHALDDGGREVLRNSVPNGLWALVEEARARVDRRLDGGWLEREA